MNLTKDAQDLHTENSKTFMREIKQDIYMKSNSMFMNWKVQYFKDSTYTQFDKYV